MPFAQLNDVKLRYAVDGDRSRPALVLSNSLGTSLEMWDPQVARLSEHFYVIRYDTRGHGQSEVTPGPYSIAQLGGDVCGLLDHLGIGRAHFCGVSMGGITGMWLALHRPSRVDRLVLSNTAAYIGPHDNWTARAEAVRRDGVASIAPAVVSRWLTPEYALAHPEQVQSLIAMLGATPAEGYAANCIAVRDNDLRKQVSGIRAPTLVIAGSGDLPTPPADAQYLLSEIAHASYVELDAAHLSNQQQPEAFADTVIRFLLAD
ncbi:3-oxoadipate enol-lactonase [Massilia horti]|uniref:3-oxoadipate enol-lactonase n=1 Tax=Massilia horti TaxID=2562153 RepID=A0A4Y9T1F3_9BURK|nr:3-oxoadipate enol-lactonase [Massilia horti]TFW31338.1 3-oxoadipate enol-lactonase [Massilia horti]